MGSCSSGGEEQNGDNLLEIHDADVATAFAIEALGLIDHYNFLDRVANPKKAVPKKHVATTSTDQKAAAAVKGIHQETCSQEGSRRKAPATAEVKGISPR